MKPDETIYAGEAQLAGWTDGHSSGVKVTFWLPSADDLDKFRALTVRKGNTAGHRVMLAVVEIGDEEQAMPAPEPVKHSEPAPKVKQRLGPYCMEACDLCKQPLFREWVSLMVGTTITMEADAKEFILRTLDITSRKEIDGNPPLIDAFIQDIRIPYIHWQREKVEG